MRRLTFAIALLLLAAPGAATAQRVRQPEYTIRDLGSLDDVGETSALAINERGEVVGFGTATNDLTAPFYWSERTGFIKIFTDVNGIAANINDKGQVVGWRNESGIIRGFLWSRSGGLVSLGSLFPVGINNRGEIVGQCESGSPAACFVADGVVRTLAMPPDGAAEVTAIDERGDVVGTLFSPEIGAGAAVWRRKTNTQTFTVLEPTAADGYNVVLGFDMNAHRVVVGTVEVVTGDVRHPVIWSRAGVADVNTSLFGFATDINNRGVVTIQSEVPLAGIAWDSRRMTVSVLPSLGGLDRPFPHDINNRGQIVGVSNNASGENHAVIWELARGKVRR